MRTEHKTSIFKYNQNNELVQYLERDNDMKIKCYYKLENNTLKRFYNNDFKENEETIKEENKSAIAFAEDCKLTHMFIDGESWVRAIKKGSSGVSFPKEEERLEAVDGVPEIYNIDSDLINVWLEKVKNSMSS